uniref:Uncharacterized protein n=1 Tax=Rhizophagus irregularis (strain DAOM 181602 / DAOM 197198 / MUCL 43194) TaxID=747089 RepID=U9U5J3_RHIID
MVAFKKCIELDPNDDLEKMYLEDSSYYLSQISNVDYNLKLFELNDDISFVYLLQKYSDFWSCLCKPYFLNDLVQLKITNNFKLYMYRAQGVYFMSNLMNFGHNYQFRESYLDRRTLSFEDNHLSLLTFPITVITNPTYMNTEYILKYKDILKLEGLGWISYMSFRSMNLKIYKLKHLTIETKKDSIDMQIEYFRITPNRRKEQIYFPKIVHLLPFYMNNIPESFKDNTFNRQQG